MSEINDAELLARLRNGAWLDEQHFPPLTWMVHGLVPEGFGLFTGPPKVGKSWAALGIVLAVASGTPALGKVPTGEARPVLLLALEDGDRRLQGRCRYLTGDEPIPALLDYQTDTAPDLVVPTIRAWLARHGPHRPLVVLDTLGKVMPPALAGEGAYQRDYRVGSVLKRLVDDHPGSCLLVVHHTRKAGSDDWMDSTSGTNGLNGSADWTLSLSRNRNEDTGLLRVSGRDVPEGEYAVTTDSGRWTIDGEALADAAEKAAEFRTRSGLSDRSGEILDYVNATEGTVTPKSVAEAITAATSTVLTNDDAGQYLRRLVERGVIRKEGRGTYTRVRSVRASESTYPFGHSDGSDTVTQTPKSNTCPQCHASARSHHPLCPRAAS